MRSTEQEKFAYSISEVLERVPFGRTRLYYEISQGNLVARKSGRRTLVLADDLEAFLKGLPTCLHKKNNEK